MARAATWQLGEVLGYRCGSGVITLIQVVDVSSAVGAREPVRCRWLRWIGDELPPVETIRPLAQRPIGPRTTVFTVVWPRGQRAAAAARALRTGVVVVPRGTPPPDGDDRSVGACSWLTVDAYLSAHYKTDRELTAPSPG